MSRSRIFRKCKYAHPFGCKELTSLTSTLRNATESPLLLLPAELRTMIWNCALMAGEIVTIREKWYTDAPSGDRIYALGSPNVRTLQVCRQIYAETASPPFQHQ